MWICISNHVSSDNGRRARELTFGSTTSLPALRSLPVTRTLSHDSPLEPATVHAWSAHASIQD